jgi:hypothetical protein
VLHQEVGFLGVLWAQPDPPPVRDNDNIGSCGGFE